MKGKESHQEYFGPDEVEISEDSRICDYCQRRHFPESWDQIECETCVHASGNYRPGQLFAAFRSDNFLGVQCTARRVKE